LSFPAILSLLSVCYSSKEKLKETGEKKRKPSIITDRTEFAQERKSSLPYAPFRKTNEKLRIGCWTGQNCFPENKNSTPMKRYLSLVMTDIPTTKYNEEKVKTKNPLRLRRTSASAYRVANLIFS